jgi:uncharacterized protein (TIGR02271 family)
MTRDLARGSVVAIFENSSDAENALRELREDGFSADRLGCATGRRQTNEEHHRSFWQKIEGFFSGDEGYEDRDTGSGEGSRQAGNVVDRTLTVPDNYNERLDAGCTMVAVYGSDRLDRAEQILLANDGEIQRNFDEHQREFATDSNRGADRNVTESEGGRIQLLSERLQINKQRVNTGEVRVRKEVRTEQQNIQVPVTREELVIERNPVSESQAIDREIGAGDEIRVPLSEERVEVEKRPVVREEVRVGKRAVEETRNVADQTRHEELKVDRSGKVADIDDEDVDRKRTA